MMVKVCPNCNFQNPDSASVCEVCGQPLNLGADPRIIDSAIDGISSLRIGMLIVMISGLIGIIMAVINGTIASSLGFFSVFGSESSVPISTSPGSTTLIINSSSLFFSLLSSTVIFALFIVSMYFIYRGFSKLIVANRRFSTGKTGSVLLLVGVVMVLIGVAIFLGFLLSIGLSGNAQTPISSILGGILAFAVLVVIGAILLLVGLIMLIIGLYRIGSIYDTGLVKAGSIVFLFINYIGAILLYVGLGKIKENLEAIRSKSTTIGEPPQ